MGVCVFCCDEWSCESGVDGLMALLEFGRDSEEGN